jgi:hypothetical protein
MAQDNTLLAEKISQEMEGHGALMAIYTEKRDKLQALLVKI